MRKILDDCLHQSVDDRLKAVVNRSKVVYLLQDHERASYVRNPLHLAADVDLACVSPWNSKWKNKRAGTLVTEQHIIYARHFSIPRGTTIRFVTGSNEVVERKLVKIEKLQGPSRGNDIAVGQLDLPIHNIKPAAVLPTHYASALSAATVVGLPVIAFDQFEELSITEVAGESRTDHEIWFKPSGVHTRKLFEKRYIEADSGNPVFVILKGQPILVTVFYGGNTGSGTSLVLRRDEINSLQSKFDRPFRLREFPIHKLENIDWVLGQFILETSTPTSLLKGLKNHRPTGWAEKSYSRTEVTGDGGVQFKVAGTTHSLICGISETFGNTTWQSTQFGLYLHQGGALSVFEGGQETRGNWTYETDDIMAVENRNRNIVYRQNGNIIHVSPEKGPERYHIDCSLEGQNAEVKDIQSFTGAHI